MYVLPLRRIECKSTVATLEAQPVGEQLGAESEGVCLVCTRCQSRYTCATCFIRYCSSACFQGHNLQCTEAFSRHRIEGVLRLERRESEQEREMTAESQTQLENVKGGRGGGEALHDIAEKLSQCNLDASLLTEDEQALLARELTVQWNCTRSLRKCAWWDEKSAVENSSIFKISTFSQVSEFITAIKELTPSLSQLLVHGRSPNPAVVYQIAGILIGYVVMMRYINGDFSDVETAVELLIHSIPQQADTTFQPLSILQVVEAWATSSALQQAVQSRSRKSLKMVLQDANQLLRHSCFVSKALIEIWVLLCRHLGYCTALSLEDTATQSPVTLQPLLKKFADMFCSPPSHKARSKSHDSLCRKIFYVLLYTLEDENQHHLSKCHQELHEYITVYMS